MALPLLLAVSTTQGSIITYTDSSSGTAPGSGSFGVPQFDPSLGTLLKVTLDVVGVSTIGSITFDNGNTDSGGVVTLDLGTNIDVASPVPFPPLVVHPRPRETTTGAFTAEEDAGGIPDYAGPDSVQLLGSSASDHKFQSLVSAAGGGSDDVSAYIGLGTLTFTWAAQIYSSNVTDITPTATFTLPPNYNFDVLITYEYDVPEPACLALICLGGLAAVRRRR